MTKERFLEQLKSAIPLDTKFDNPGGGVSMIVGIGDEKLSYIRGSSRMYLPYDAVVEVLNKYSGKTISSSDLKECKASVFDSTCGGHSCNCTLMFSVLERMGLTVGSIKGAGRRGSPFYITLAKI